MRLLLDTHVVLWWLSDDAGWVLSRGESIADVARSRSAPRRVWEIAIKEALGQAPSAVRTGRTTSRRRVSIPLPITFDHAVEAGALPRHHADPFDRMLVAQARIEGLTIVTADPKIARYDVPTMAP